MRTSTKYPPKKAQMYQQLQDLPKKYRVVGIVRTAKVRSSQILPLRKKLKDQVLFVSIKDRIAKKALEQTGIPGIAGIVSKLNGQCLLMLTDMSPFKLNLLLAKNKMMLAARAGDVASVDVVVREQNTGIAPGPMLTEFKEAKIPTKIDQGTIWIMKDTIPAKKGEVISDKLAPLLTKLDIKPVEAGIELAHALEDGVLYGADELTIDVEAVRNEFAQRYQEALNLSIEAGYVTPENASFILSKAFASARNLAVEAGFATSETINAILQKARSHAAALEQAAS